jgi:hypothetical protein
MTVTVTVRPGQLTVPNRAVSGRAAGVADVRGAGTAVVGVAVGRGLRMDSGGVALPAAGVGVRGVGVCDAAERAGVVAAAGVGRDVAVVVVREGAGEPTGDGVPDACDVESLRVSAGIAMSAPMTKKTAAMTNLDNCMSPPRHRSS